MTVAELGFHESIGSSARRAAFSTVVGNALEWFDFSCYAFFATLISRKFFPSGDATTALLGAFAVFGLGLVARPLGAVLFGRLGDSKGRKVALLIAMPMMGLSTIALGLLPTYSQIGIAAPFILLLCRLLQGFSAGGEVGNAIAFLIEWSPHNKRAFYSSLQQASAVTGTLLGSLMAASLTTLMASDSLESWGWRLPFLFGGLVVAPLGYYLRSKVDETPAFVKNEHHASIEPKRPVESIWLLGAKTVGVSTAWVVCFYVFMIYAPSFLTRHGHIPKSLALWMNTAGLLTEVVFILIASTIADILGRKPLLLFASFVFLVFAFPLFHLYVNSENTSLIFCAVVASGAMVGVFAGTVPATMAEMFPTSSRTTGMSIGFGISTAIFGGFASLISETLVRYTGSELSPSFFVILATLITISVVLTIKETAHSALR